MPMKKELTAKAESLANIGRMPMISAAMSMSRIAIQVRPIRLRTRFLASSASRATKTSRKRYLASGVPEVPVTTTPGTTSRGGAEITPEGL